MKAGAGEPHEPARDRIEARRANEMKAGEDPGTVVVDAVEEAEDERIDIGRCVGGDGSNTVAERR